MAYFTSYDSLSFIDIARNNKNTGTKSSVQGFLYIVLNISNKKLITSEHVNYSRYNLRQGNNISSAIENCGLSDEEIIENIRNNIVSAKSIEDLDKSLIEKINAADNLAEGVKTSLISMPDFATRIYNALLITLDNQTDDRKLLQKKRISIDEDHVKYAELEERINEQEGYKTNKDSLLLTKTLDSLKKVSSYIYDTLFDERSRFYEYEIDPQLLTNGLETKLTTYGKCENDSYEMSTFFKLKDNLFITGLGGVGKSTYCVNELDTLKNNPNSIYIPLYISLNKLKNKKYSSSYIKSEILSLIESVNYVGINKAKFDPHEQEVYLDEVFNYTKANKKILLMLDGYNEISNMASSSIRFDIKNEIETLSECSNVRIILTSRPFYKSEESFKSFKHITATGINEDTLISYLKDNSIDMPQDEDMLSILQIPLFLKMHTINHKNNVKDALTRGAILYEYYNGTSSIYNELLVLKDPKYNFGNLLPEYVPLILDFIMPAIAANMEMNDSFSISLRDVNNIIKEAESLAIPFDDLNDPYFDKYDARGMLSILARDLINSGSDVIKLLTDRFSFLERDSENNLSFVHQYIKDYFACMFRILTYRQRFLAHDDMYWNYAHSLMDESTSGLTKEISLRSKLCSLDIMKEVIDSCPDKSDSLFINNLFMMTSIFNNNSLAGINFVEFDLSNVSLTRYSFSNEYGHSNFINCKFSESSLMAYEYSQKIFRCYSFYNERPALIEVIQNDERTIFNVIDIKSKQIIYNEDWSYFTYDKPHKYFSVNGIITSEDNNYIVLYDADFDCDEIYVYDRKEQYCSTYFIPEFKNRTLLKFYKDHILLIVSDESDFTFIDLLDSSSNGTSNHGDSDTISDFSLPIINPFWSETEQLHFVFRNIYKYKDNYILVYNSYNSNEIVYRYSPDTDELKPIFLPEKKNNESVSVTSCLHDNHLYVLYRNTVYDIDLDTNKIDKCGDLSYLLTSPLMNMYDDKLYIYGNYNLYTIDIKQKEVIQKRKAPYNYFHQVTLMNHNYVIAGLAAYSCFAYTFRLDIDTVSEFKYVESTGIQNVIYLSNNRIIVCYSSGYIALVNSDTMSLIRAFSLPNFYDIKSVVYNKHKEQIAVSIGDIRMYSKPTTVHIIDTAVGSDTIYKKIKTMTNHYYENTLCYSQDGHYLFEGDMGTIHVYDTHDYHELAPIEIGESVVCMEAIDDKICVFVSEEPALKTSEVSLIIVDTNDIYADILYHELIEYDSFDDNFDDVFVTYLADRIYEIIYPEKKDPYDYKKDLRYRFFLLKSDQIVRKDTLSDYYQDGILIKCSDRNINTSTCEMHELKFMSSSGGYIDDNKEFYFGLNKSYSLEKIELKTHIGIPSSVIPGLLIEGCNFEFDSNIPVAVKFDIENNLGNVIIK